jgi:hypothetical protein
MLGVIKQTGEWWIPSNPETKTKGILTFSQDKGANLELETYVDGDISTMLGNISPIGNVTLLRCIPLTAPVFAKVPGVPYRLLSQQVILGAHYENDIKLDSLHINFSNLFEWIHRSGINPDELFKKDIVIQYHQPESISLQIAPELSIRIDFRPSVYANNKGELRLNERAIFSLDNKEPIELNACLELMHHFRNFLCLAIQSTIFPKEIYWLNNEGRTNVQLMFQLDAISNSEYDPFNNLVEFKDIEHRFGTYLKDWYLKRKNLEPICQLYFGSQYGRFVYLNLKFLSMIQALESYHRAFISNEELTKSEHEKRIAAIMETAPKIHETWLAEKLQYSNEPSLRKRIKTILEMFPKTVPAIIPDPKWFINRAVRTRNYMNHFDPVLKDEASNNTELFALTERLRVIVEMCLLKEIGFDLDEINTKITNHYSNRLKLFRLS